MELFDHLALGFEVALSAQSVFYCLVGVSLGMFIGVLPGIGPLATISMLLPITYYLPASVALIMLAGIYYGAQYGGSIASILLNLPGTASASVICLDGYPMAKQGRAGVAIFLTTLASFVGSMIAIFILAAFAPPLSRFALNFGAADYFSMMVVGLVAAATLAQGSALKGLVMVCLGLLLSIVGIDLNTGIERFTFGSLRLWDGFSVMAIAMGIFGVAEVVMNAGDKFGRGSLITKKVTWRSLLPTRADVMASIKPILRGAGIGTGFGILPGTGVSIAAFVAYAVEKRVARDPKRFGKGAVEGVTAPEAANNATAQSAFIPTLTLGIPGDAVMALMLGAMILHGIEPGPQVVVGHPELFWGLVVSFWIGNLILVLLNLPLIGIWVRFLAIPYSFLYPAVLLFICIGIYSVNNNVFDVFLVMIFGVMGVIMRILKLEPAPLLLGFILGTMLEENLRRALILSEGSFDIFVIRPISATFLGMVAFLIGLMVWTAVKERKQARARGTGDS